VLFIADYYSAPSHLRAVYNFSLLPVQHLPNLACNERFSCAWRSKQQHALKRECMQVKLCCMYCCVCCMCVCVHNECLSCAWQARRQHALNRRGSVSSHTRGERVGMHVSCYYYTRLSTNECTGSHDHVMQCAELRI